VLLNRTDRVIYIYELTVAFETRIEAAHELKAEKYNGLCNDLCSLGWKVEFHAFEVGSRGHMPDHTKVSLYKLLKLTNHTVAPKTLYSTVSKLIASGSYKLFIARKETSWISPPFLTA